MKKEINILRLLFIAVIVIVVVIVAAFVFINDQIDYNKLTEVRIKKMGTMLPTGDEYTLTLKDGTWVASHNHIEWFEDNVKESIVEEAFANNIKEILKENKAHKWDAFNLKYEIEKLLAPIATDGVHYSFYMFFSDGSVTQIEQYNSRPETFMTVLEAFEKQYKILFGE